jgi:transcriptional regulator with XRE-family HTH domain
MKSPQRETGEIGERVRASRLRRGWSREELAVESGLSWSGITQIESGRRTNLRPGTLTSLARALRVSVDYLLDGGLETPVLLNHQALVYEGDDSFAAEVVPFVLEGLERSEYVLVATSKGNLALLKKELGPDIRRVKTVESSRWYLTPTETLAGYTDYLRECLAEGAPWVRIVGEPVWEGRTRSQVQDWTRYEALLNLSFAQAPASILCPYDAGSLPPAVIGQMHMTHPETIENGTVLQSSEFTDPGASVLGF